jgi:hypothetical protein
MLPPPAAAEQQPQQQQQAELPPPAPLPPAALDPYSPSSMIGAWDTEPGPDPLLSMSGNLQGLSASEKLQALKQVQQVSNKALTKVAVASSTYYANAPKTIDIRMYDQLVAAHNKLSQKFSDTNAHIAVLEERLNASNEDLIAAFELMKQVRAARAWLGCVCAWGVCLACVVGGVARLRMTQRRLPGPCSPPDTMHMPLTSLLACVLRAVCLPGRRSPWSLARPAGWRRARLPPCSLAWTRRTRWTRSPSCRSASRRSSRCACRARVCGCGSACARAPAQPAQQQRAVTRAQHTAAVAHAPLHRQRCAHPPYPPPLLPARARAHTRQAVLEQREEFGKRVVRKVPVEWIGVASEVKIMGDFDDWTRGEDLSAEDVASDSVYSRFEGVLTLRPGTYKVKFLVDQEWRLAADWPTGKDQHGNDVCLLTVT